MGIHNGSTKLQQYTEELWNEYTNDEDIVIRKFGNNLNAKPKKAKKLFVQQPKKKAPQPNSASSEESEELKELKDFLEDNLAVGFGSLVPSTNKKRVRNRKPKAKKQTNQPINLQEELNKFDDGWETMLYRNNKRELNKMKRDIQKEEKIQKIQMENKSFIRHNQISSASNESEVKSQVKVRPSKESVKNKKMIKKQLDQQIELQKQKQQKKNEMEKWNQKMQNEKKKQQKTIRGNESNFNSIIQEHQQMKEQIKIDNSKPKSAKSKPQSEGNEIQRIIQKQVEQEKKQKEQELIKARKELAKVQKEKKNEKLIKQQKHLQMVQKANNKGKK
ncbi:hypothetical protein H8356DRAFT_1638462 [Neocallimastix lanati (nom. inval.)]|jgi:DNA repair exonuclease SbcCD ATPase subunit|uniref:Uncharacterized protein n=1 Tax=Neocallimastix californiae TaxID=1754190 RepID=A0A1Y2DRF0_9FUNG|nr:hypothetical protein H8356DRAFT_1638462 [Neocallimastix sp. JGI-2020a]ORY61850.1 hypothetical protein LY90DRAFT_701123 [Neocallimastix californiae]|eukprot:ORY61850.1 hypothetical protein LY90DRAFT_701123 [Neocallimastix californiae]